MISSSIRADIQRYIIILIFILLILLPNETNATSQPQRIVVFPIYAEEVLVELIDLDRIIYVGHEYIEDCESYYPTMSITKYIPGRNWQNCDEYYISQQKPDLLILPDGLQDIYANAFPIMFRQKVPVLFLAQPNSAEEIGNMILLLGNAVGEKEKATDLAEQFLLNMTLLEKKLNQYKNLQLKVTYYEQGQNALSMLSEQCHFSIYMTDDQYQLMNDQDICSWNPDIIFFDPVNYDTDGSILDADAEYMLQYILKDPFLLTTNAVLQKKVFPLHLHYSQFYVDDVKYFLNVI